MMKERITSILLRIPGKLPLKFHYCIGDFLAFLAEKVLRYRKSVVEINLARSFPDLKYDGLRKLTHDFYKHFGEIFAEMFWFWGCRTGKRLRNQNLVRILNPEVINDAYEKAPSVMVMVSHCGNWELYGGLFSMGTDGEGFRFGQKDFCFVYKKQSSNFSDAVLRFNRSSTVNDPEWNGYIESNDIIRYVMEHKGQKKIYCMNTDQKPYSIAKGAIPVNFMHQDTTAMIGAARIAQKIGMAVLYLDFKRERRGYYSIRFINICDDASESTSEEITTKYYKLLEDSLNMTPANYLWTHKRWK